MDITNKALQQSSVFTTIDSNFPELVSLFKPVKDVTNQWLNEIWPQIILVRSEIIDYDDTFESTINKLTGNPSQEDGDLMNILLPVLIKNLQEKQGPLRANEENVRQLHDKFTLLQYPLEGRNRELEQKRSAYVHKVETLEAELKTFDGLVHSNEIEKKINELNKDIVRMVEMEQELIIYICEFGKPIIDSLATLMNYFVPQFESIEQTISTLRTVVDEASQMPVVIRQAQLQQAKTTWKSVVDAARALTVA